MFTAGICPPDSITFDYVQQRTDAPFDAVQADAGASYLEEYRFDVSKLEPLVAAPHSPDNRKKAAECSNVNIDRVYIGYVVHSLRLVSDLCKAVAAVMVHASTTVISLPAIMSSAATLSDVLAAIHQALDVRVSLLSVLLPCRC